MTAPGFEFDPVKFREILAKREMTLNMLHRDSEVSMNTINRLYRGMSRNPNIGFLARICHSLQTPIESLLKKF